MSKKTEALAAEALRTKTEIQKAQAAFKEDKDAFITAAVVQAYQDNHATETIVTKVIEELADKAVSASDGEEALHYTQAALNLAYVISTLEEVGKQGYVTEIEEEIK